MKSPDISLFKSFVINADLFLLKKLRSVINSEITKKTPDSIRLVRSEPLDLNGKLTPKNSLSTLINDDWGELFSEYSNSGSNHDVYIHIDPNSNNIKYNYSEFNIDINIPYYVGVGQGERIYSLKRSVMHLNKLNGLLDNGLTKKEIMIFFEKGMSELKARELESKLILFFGIKTAIISKSKKIKALSGHAPSLFNNRYESFPKKYHKYAYKRVSYSSTDKNFDLEVIDE